MSFHYHSIQLVALLLRVFAPRGRTHCSDCRFKHSLNRDSLKTRLTSFCPTGRSLGMTMKTATLARCASRAGGVLIISAHANERRKAKTMSIRFEVCAEPRKCTEFTTGKILNECAPHDSAPINTNP